MVVCVAEKRSPVQNPLLKLLMMAYNLGVKLAPLMIAAFGLVWSPAVIAAESGGDRETGVEVTSEDQSRSAQCEQLKQTVATIAELRSELPTEPTSESDTPPSTEEVIEYLNAASHIFAQMSELFKQIGLSDTHLRSTAEAMALRWSSMSSDFTQIASLMAVLDIQQQQIQQAGEIDSVDPTSRQNLADSFSTLGKIMTLFQRVNQNNDELKPLSADLKRHCGSEDSVENNQGYELGL